MGPPGVNLVFVPLEQRRNAGILHRVDTQSAGRTHRFVCARRVHLIRSLWLAIRPQVALQLCKRKFESHVRRLSDTPARAPHAISFEGKFDDRSATSKWFITQAERGQRRVDGFPRLRLRQCPTQCGRWFQAYPSLERCVPSPYLLIAGAAVHGGLGESLSGPAERWIQSADRPREARAHGPPVGLLHGATELAELVMVAEYLKAFERLGMYAVHHDGGVLKIGIAVDCRHPHVLGVAPIFSKERSTASKICSFVTRSDPGQLRT